MLEITFKQQGKIFYEDLFFLIVFANTIGKDYLHVFKNLKTNFRNEKLYIIVE